jgi:hypothetical protein
MKVINFETKKEAEQAWRELYNTGFCGSDLTIQYNGSIGKHQLVISHEEDSYRSDFKFEN